MQKEQACDIIEERRGCCMNGGQTERRNRRRTKRKLLCPAHPKQVIEGNGRKYYLHLLQPEQLQERGVSSKKAKLVINAYKVLVLSNEWLEELFCPECGRNRWCHITKHDKIAYTVQWAAKDLWKQVANVDITGGNPTVSEYTKRNARRNNTKPIGK